MLSTLSANEMIEIKSALISTHNKKYYCDHCLTDKFRGDEKKLKTERRVLGCHGVVHHVVYKGEGLVYHKCVGNFCNEDDVSWIEFYDKWEKGVMPYPGNYMEQPSKVIEVMRIIGNYKVNWEAERASKEQMKRKAPRLRRGR